MRTVVMATVVLLLAAGLSVAAAAQPNDEGTGQPPTEVSGRFPCPYDEQEEGTLKIVPVRRLEEGSVIRHEGRGNVTRWNADGMSDPRLDGTLSVYVNYDEYIERGTDAELGPGLASVVLRIKNDEGAWQGSHHEASLPGVPFSEWGTAVLTGEGAYEGLTVALAERWVDEPCGYEVRGMVFEGAVPPMPDPAVLAAE